MKNLCKNNEVDIKMKENLINKQNQEIYEFELKFSEKNLDLTESLKHINTKNCKIKELLSTIEFMERDIEY
jgi:hypothetical protein